MFRAISADTPARRISTHLDHPPPAGNTPQAARRDRGP
jgi:hypothetical protein